MRTSMYTIIGDSIALIGIEDVDVFFRELEPTNEVKTLLFYTNDTVIKARVGSYFKPLIRIFNNK